MKKLHLLSKPLDVNALAKMFEAMTGRRPTPAEMAAARAELQRPAITKPSKLESR